MSFLEFTVPPFPVFIAAGEGVFKKGETHVRRVFPVFDLLYVKKGVLYISSRLFPSPHKPLLQNEATNRMSFLHCLLFRNVQGREKAEYILPLQRKRRFRLL